MRLDVDEPAARYSSGPTARQLIFLTVFFWAVEVFLAELRSVVDHSAKLELYTYLRLLSAAFGSLECYFIHLVARATTRWRVGPRGALILALAAVAGLINLKSIDALQNLSSFPVSDYGMGWRIYNATYWCLMFMAWAAVYLAIDYNREAVGQERRARELERLEHDAQLAALRFQVDPHFLFNTLNSVSALVLEDRNVDAEEMIQKLAEFFRATLVTNPRQDVTLGEEIALQLTYLEIEKVRFPNLSVDFDVHPDALDALVPSLLLQPLVENAVKFAVAGRRGPTRLGIVVPQPVGGTIRIEVWDDGNGKPPQQCKGTGTGLSNVRDRLKIRFGKEASLELCSRVPTGTNVRVTIPFTAYATSLPSREFIAIGGRVKASR